MVERSLFAIIDLLQRTKSLFLYFKWRVGGWFSLKISNFRKKNFHFILFHLIFLCYYCCSINPKRQSEHSGLRPDTSSLVSVLLLVSNLSSPDPAIIFVPYGWLHSWGRWIVFFTRIEHDSWEQKKLFNYIHEIFITVLPRFTRLYMETNHFFRMRGNRNKSDMTFLFGIYLFNFKSWVILSMM